MVFCRTDSQYRQLSLTCAKFFRTLNAHAHANTHSSLSNTRKTRGYLHKSMKPTRNLGRYADHRLSDTAVLKAKFMSRGSAQNTLFSIL